MGSATPEHKKLQKILSGVESVSNKEAYGNDSYSAATGRGAGGSTGTGTFTVQRTGQAIGATPEQAIRKTYRSDEEDK